MGAAGSLARRFMPGPEEGAESVVHLAASPEVTGCSGGYFVRDRRVQPNPQAEDPEVGRHLWRVLERLTYYTSPTQSPWPHHSPRA